MGFLKALNRFLRPASEKSLQASERVRLLEAWGLSDTSHPEFPGDHAPTADPADMTAPPVTTTYDRIQWERKLRTVLEGLPEHAEQWDDMLADATALGFDPEWVRDRQRVEFRMLIRRSLADSRVTPEEHRKLELARSLIGLSEAEAEAMLQETVNEAEAIFGKEVEGKA